MQVKLYINGNFLIFTIVIYCLRELLVYKNTKVFKRKK